MTERPPPLSNGYVWMCNTLMPPSKVQLLEQQLGQIRHELRVRDFGDPSSGNGVELWVHPDDEPRAGFLIMGLLAE